GTGHRWWSRRPPCRRPAPAAGGATPRGCRPDGQVASGACGQPSTSLRAPICRETGEATAAIGWLPGTPDPSRRPLASGSSTGAPLLAAARAGPGPAQAATNASSPLRKRWARTPPVARPLAGYSVKGVTLTAPGSVPGRAVDEPEAVTATASVGSKAP